MLITKEMGFGPPFFIWRFEMNLMQKRVGAGLTLERLAELARTYAPTLPLTF
jgi:hypothetical protein